jgi:MATE family multidrug resistance protein
VTTYRQELERVARLSAPVVVTQLGLMMIGVVDTLMLGRVGVTTLAGVALGNAWQWTFTSFGLGLVTGIDPLISQAHGRADGPATALALQRGIVVALLASLPICVLSAAAGSGLAHLGQEGAVVAVASRYNLYKLPTIPCFLVYSALRQYLQGRGIMAPATWTMWIGNLFHVGLNYALIFGHFGLPALGARGAAIASSFSTAFLVAMLVAMVLALRLHGGAWRPWSREAFAPRELLRVLRLGAPVGLTISLESTAFSASTALAGWLGHDALAAHQIVLNMASLAFMVPLGIAQGASVRIGNLIGAGDVAGMRRAVRVSLALGAGVMVFSASAFALLRFELPRLFTSEPNVLALAAAILPLAAAFQLFDGTQTVASGALRGMGRPDASAVVNLLGYYAFALPLAYVLAIRRGYGLGGIWAAFALGLIAIALALLSWVRRTARRPLSELQVQRLSSVDQPAGR